MLKNVCQYLSVTTVVVALSMFFTPEITGAATVLVHQFGKLQGPSRMALSNSGNIYVTDYDQGLVAIYDAIGNKIGLHKNLTSPLGLALYDPPVPMAPDYCSGGGKLTRDQKKECKWWANQPPPPPPSDPVVYVVDEGDGSVQIFDNGNVNTLGIGSGEFIKPNGIAVTATQQVYVVDSKAQQKVKVYDNSGAFLFAFGSYGAGEGGQLDFPIDIVLNEILGEVYVSDFWNGRIVVFDLAGTWLRNIQTPANGCGDAGVDPVYSRPSGLGIDPDGNLYVADNALSTVTSLTRMGTLIDVIGFSNCEYWNGQVPSPRDVASDGQKIYVASGGKGVVQVFEVTP